jgi:hypothetical protein
VLPASCRQKSELGLKILENSFGPSGETPEARFFIQQGNEFLDRGALLQIPVGDSNSSSVITRPASGE